MSCSHIESVWTKPTTVSGLSPWLVWDLLLPCYLLSCVSLCKQHLTVWHCCLQVKLLREKFKAALGEEGSRMVDINTIDGFQVLLLLSNTPSTAFCLPVSASTTLAVDLLVMRCVCMPHFDMIPNSPFGKLLMSALCKRCSHHFFLDAALAEAQLVVTDARQNTLISHIIQFIMCRLVYWPWLAPMTM